MTVSTRSLSRGLGKVVAELELRQPSLVTLEEIAGLAERAGIGTAPKIVAARLRATGWLLSTAQRGVYEFAPGSHAGPYGHGDPFVDLRAALLKSDVPVAIALRSALWLHGLAERAPDRHELAVPSRAAIPAALVPALRVVRFAAHAEHGTVDALPVHRPASVLAHLAAKPGDVRGWATFAEALPELVAMSTADELEYELQGHSSAARPRLAYLLSGVAPDLADVILPNRPAAVTWFGKNRVSLRYDKRFNVADGLLPFDPRALDGPA